MTYLKSLHEISDEVLLDIRNIAIKKNFSKNHILIPHLGKCENLYFIEKGLARAFFYNNGKEITDWFGIENMVIGPTIRNFTIKNTPHCVELLEDSEIIIIPFSELEKLYKKYHEVERIGRLIAINTILDLQYKIDSLQLHTAKERYSFFLLKYPTLAKRVALGQIASYLGMNQVTLSRIRKEK